MSDHALGSTRGWLRSPLVRAAAVIAAGAAVFLVVQHPANTLRALPFVVIAACALLHLFMHGGHGGHGAAGAPPNVEHQHGRPGR